MNFTRSESDDGKKDGGAQRKPCIRCLLSESGDELYRTVREYISALPDEVKADGRVYVERLKICGGCDKLMRGTCVLCGCYVEARAAKSAQHCPAVPNKW